MISTEKWNGIRALVQTERSGSFAAAGQVLGLSPSAVGKSVARLERRLGVRLFHRTTRRLSLTDEGRAYHDSCVRALAELEAASAALVQGGNAPSGRLRMSVPDLFGRTCVAPVLLDVARRYPLLRLDVPFGNRQVNLAEEAFDLVLRIGTPPQGSAMIARHIGRQRLVLCASPAYLADAPQLATTTDLHDHACLAQSGAGGAEPWLLLDGEGAIRRMKLDDHHRFAGLDVLAEAASRGMGIAQLPFWLVREHLADGRLVTVLQDVPQPALPINLLWLPAPFMAPRVRVVVDALAHAFAADMTW